jgi:hypothetical protein
MPAGKFQQKMLRIKFKFIFKLKNSKLKFKTKIQIKMVSNYELSCLQEEEAVAKMHENEERFAEVEKRHSKVHYTYTTLAPQYSVTKCQKASVQRPCSFNLIESYFLSH